MTRRRAAFQAFGDQGVQQPAAEARQGFGPFFSLFRQMRGGLVVVNLPSQGGLQFSPMLRDPEVKVGLRAFGETLKQLVLADGFHDGQIDGVVPVGGGFREGDLTLCRFAHEVAVHGNVFFQLVITPGDGHFQIGVGTCLVQACSFEEGCVFPFEDEILHPQIGGDGHGRVYFGHIRLNVGGAELPGDGDAMMAVLDEIGGADLVEFHRRQAGHVLRRHFDPRPAFFVAVVQGQEAAGEVGVTIHTADDGVERDVV